VRTTTQLNPETLKRIRESKGWTQQQLADMAFGAGQSKSEDPSSHLRIYQRIEKTGRTSPMGAKNIAEALGFKVDDLTKKEQIEQLESAKFIAEKIEQRIRKLRLSDDHVSLARIAKTFGCALQEILSWDSPENDWNYLDVAVDLVVEIPKLEFLGKTSEIQEIYENLGLQSHHFQPASLRDSFWWVYSELSESQTGYGTLVQNTNGVHILLNELKDAILRRFRYAHVKFTLSKVENRDRLEVQVNRGYRQYLFECIPCEVQREKGIIWKEPTALEVDVVRHELIDIAMNLSDVVIIDGITNPSDKFPLLCHITKFENSDANEYDKNWSTNEKYTFHSKTHRPNWVTTETKMFYEKFEIASYLNEILADKEKREFEFRKIHAGIELNVIRKDVDVKFNYDVPLARLEIYLGWLNDEGKFEKAPWTESKRDQFIELRRTDSELDRHPKKDESVDLTSNGATTSTGVENVDEI
jgi:transcriptional regulator with XRE-family HTH domain